MSPTLIERREFKYLIDETMARRVRAAISPFCVLDDFAAAQERQAYTIRSLYFDTPNLALFQANEMEIAERFKLRVRTYPDDGCEPVFFEVKRRYNDVIRKERARVPEGWEGWLTGRPSPPIPEDQAVHSFVSLHQGYGCGPVVTVSYEREPWASTVDDYARVTLDRRICAQAARETDLSIRDGGWRSLDSPAVLTAAWSPTILELKFTSQVPSWMVNMVQTLGLARRAFSKYGRAVETVYEERPFRRAAAPEVP